MNWLLDRYRRFFWILFTISFYSVRKQTKNSNDYTYENSCSRISCLQMEMTLNSISAKYVSNIFFFCYKAVSFELLFQRKVSSSENCSKNTVMLLFSDSNDQIIRQLYLYRVYSKEVLYYCYPCIKDSPFPTHALYDPWALIQKSLPLFYKVNVK